MLKLLSFNTANNIKPILLLEELGLEYTLIPINIRAKEQLSPAFLKINPMHQVPVLVDEEKKLTLTESGAIMLYLAEKNQKLLGDNEIKKAQILKWFFWQTASLSSSCVNYFRSILYGEKDQDRIKAQQEQIKILYKLFNDCLGNNNYIANNEYSIADIAIFTWLNAYKNFGIEDISAYPNIARYIQNINNKPAVKKAYEKIKSINWEDKNSSEDELAKIITNIL